MSGMQVSQQHFPGGHVCVIFSQLLFINFGKHIVLVMKSNGVEEVVFY